MTSATLPDDDDDDDPGSIRLAHLRTESDVKSVGQLCYLATVLSAFGTIEFFLVAIRVLPYDPNLHQIAGRDLILGFFWVMTALILLNTIAQAALAYGLTHLQSWARWTVVALTGLSLASTLGLGLAVCFTYPAWGLLSLVIGGALHAVILYPLLTPAAGVVFSRRYQEIIRATPTIQSRMHGLLKLLIIMILAGVFILVAYLIGLYLRLID